MRPFNLESFFVPTVSGLPFCVRMESGGKLVTLQTIFDSDLRARGFMNDHLIKPLVEELVPGGAFGVLKMGVEALRAFFDNGLRVIVNPIPINTRRTDFDEVVLRDGKFWYLESEAERE